MFLFFFSFILFKYLVLLDENTLAELILLSQDRGKNYFSSALASCFGRCGGDAALLGDMIKNIASHLFGDCNRDLCGSPHDDDNQVHFGPFTSPGAKKVISAMTEKWSDKKITVKYCSNVTTNYVEYINSIEGQIVPKSKHMHTAEGYALTAYYAASYVMVGPKVDQLMLEEYFKNEDGFELTQKQEEEMGKRQRRYDQHSERRSSEPGKLKKVENKVKRRMDGMAGQESNKYNCKRMVITDFHRPKPDKAPKLHPIKDYKEYQKKLEENPAANECPLCGDKYLTHSKCTWKVGDDQKPLPSLTTFALLSLCQNKVPIRPGDIPSWRLFYQYVAMDDLVKHRRV